MGSIERESIMPTMDWRTQIADAARPALMSHGVGAVIVRFSAKGCEVVSRFYALSDYRDSRHLAATVWSRATRWINADGEGTNYYVVNRYEDASIVVYNTRHSILYEA